ncbi:hypothetical protein QBC46DRAFT_344195 [Diplogelasinospora grovesii]|uniref:Uncharacterized protein n=1 Tax=Diplogelasinospora grovesii TaxID=303347 RepID=A0AAN6N268_9PEZI|nr:hypothetical protein QBC46DRAFT_344195 [Diplogelasinospora grovesii]
MTTTQKLTAEILTRLKESEHNDVQSLLEKHQNAIRPLEMKTFYKDGEKKTATLDIENATHATAIALYQHL